MNTLNIQSFYGQSLRVIWHFSLCYDQIGLGIPDERCLSTDCCHVIHFNVKQAPFILGYALTTLRS
jgi:hypothetical protein